MTEFLKNSSIMKPDSFKVKSVIFSFALLVLVSGCTDEDVDTVVVAPTKKVAEVDVMEEEMEEVVEVKRETWTSVDIVSNPFATFFRIAEAGGTKPRSPLECCDLLQFKISIIISGSGVSRPYATVLDPSNNRIIVNEGMHMGLNRGEVVKINRDGITVREPISDKSGKTVDHIDILLPTVQGR